MKQTLEPQKVQSGSVLLRLERLEYYYNTGVKVRKQCHPSCSRNKMNDYVPFGW